MTSWCGLSDPTKQRSGGLDITARLGPSKGSPTPPGGQLSATNKRLRNSCTQETGGVKTTFHGIWADPKDRGHMRTGPARAGASTSLLGAARESGKS